MWHESSKEEYLKTRSQSKGSSSEKNKKSCLIGTMHQYLNEEDATQTLILLRPITTCCCPDQLQYHIQRGNKSWKKPLLASPSALWGKNYQFFKIRFYLFEVRNQQRLPLEGEHRVHRSSGGRHLGHLSTGGGGVWTGTASVLRGL